MPERELRCEIKIGGVLDPCWFEWFDGLTVTNLENGETVLAGRVADQAAVHSVLGRIRDLNLRLISVQIGE